MEKGKKNEENLLNNDKIKQFVLDLNSEKQQEFHFIQNLMVLYTDNSLKQIKTQYNEGQLSSKNINLSEILEVTYSNVFNVFATKKNNCDKASLELIFQYLDLISDKICQKLKENPEKLNQKDLKSILDSIEIQFITSLLDVISDKISPSHKEKYQSLKSQEEKQHFLTLLTFLPETFFKNGTKADFKALLQAIISEFLLKSHSTSDFFNSILTLILVFTNLYLEEFLNLKEEEKNKN